MSVRLVMFDVDGTLIDSQSSIVACMERTFASHALPPPSALAVRRIIGLPLTEGILRLRPTLTPVEAGRAADAYRRNFMAARLAGQLDEALFPGVEAMLNELSQAGYMLGIATGKSMRGLQAMLEKHQLAHYFTTLQTGDEPPGKPHPAMLQRAFAQTGIAPPCTVMVGDTVFDIEMANAAGVASIGVSWGYHAPEELTAAGAVCALSGWPQLLSSIAALPGA